MQSIVSLSRFVNSLMSHSAEEPPQSPRFREFTSELRSGQIALGLFEALPDIMFWIKDREGIIIFANRAYAQMLRRTPDDLVGESDASLFAPTMANFFQTDDETVLRTKEPLHNKLEIITRPEGGIEWRMTSKIPLFNEGGHVIGTAGISRRLEHGEVPRSRPLTGPSQNSLTRSTKIWVPNSPCNPLPYRQACQSVPWNAASDSIWEPLQNATWCTPAWR